MVHHHLINLTIPQEKLPALCNGDRVSPILPHEGTVLSTQRNRPWSVSNRGAHAGCVLHGAGLTNQGLRLQVLQDQTTGNDGPIKGTFLILDLGSNRHSQSLRVLLHQVTDAAEVVELIRQEHPGCVNVANAGSLVLEQD
jgi:hypothetical protein